MSDSFKFLLAAMAPAIVVSASAQVTTSSVGGRVTGEQGEALEGASIIAVHQPSGSRYKATTNHDGRYTIQGMRTGGPYKIEISYIGFQKKTYNNLSLELGAQLPLDATLSENDETLGEAVVQGTASRNRGAGENFSLSTITQTPTISRHIYDVVKTTPLVQTNKAGGISIAGQNNRYNSFMVDGTVSNDVFGLSSSGTNGGQAASNPISIDAIQEIQVSVAPFDVRQSGFTGGAINAVTKQGTNEFHGSAYWLFNNQDMYGRYRFLDHTKDPMSKQSTNTFGFTFGGPLVKDKLFFFTSMEHVKKTYPSTYYPGYSDRALTTETADAILNAYEARTGIRDAYGSRDVATQSLSLLARLDWNINDNNKLAFRYQHNNGYDDKYSASPSRFFFNNSSYKFNNSTNSFVAELNSHLSEKVYNEFRVSATFVRDHRDVPYQGPTAYIRNVSVQDAKYTANVNLGTEYSSGVNYLDQDIYNLEDNLSLYLGNHTVTIGTHNEFYRMKNAFIQYANGEWEYDGLEAFLQDKPSRFYYYYSDPTRTNGDLKWAPNMYFGQFGVYGQDKWNVTPDFELTYGIRFDLPMAFNNPSENPEYNLHARQYGFPLVGKQPTAKLMVSPRVGFRWHTDEERTSLLRGGVGLFTGRVPFVWLSNTYNNTGVELKKMVVQGGTIPTMTDYATKPYEGVQNATSRGAEIVTASRNFRYPQALRFNLGYERRLPGDVKMTLEALYTKNFNAVFFENLALADKGAKVYAVPGVEASATTYYNQLSRDYANVINLRNTNKGYSYSLSALFEKDFDFGLGIKASYTFGHSKSVNDGTSSIAASNFGYNYSVRANDRNEMSYSRFDIPHRVMFQVNYTSPKYLAGWMSSEVGVIYNGSNGGRYCLLMNESADYNGDSYRSNSLMYIPTKEELQQMVFADRKIGGVMVSAAQQRENVEAWIAGDKYASKHRGQYAQRNSNLTDWEHEINLHFAQNIFLPRKWGCLQVSLDILNFANMLNKKWGATYGNVYSVEPLGISKMTKDASGNYTPTFYDNTANATVLANDIFSRWRMQLGIRYRF